MKAPNCSEICPWVRNTQDLDHYICLKCGQERFLNKMKSNQPPLGLLILMVMAILVTVLVQERKTPEQAAPQLDALSTP
ncbi:hypothetical protein [Roseofilum capinflatum]|uniref:Uncharacterized protein n=1 Tax=Roseofilum capinflatum BLCC-M114 TaxID=3022440 RepID=A0ABT7B3R8_9CYAN|nr:hypothetical protein [Roseofilum capinflatum]MDJ1173780.1 hypothetical protein [Roseofilum capinflatum BLCC-M114]